MTSSFVLKNLDRRPDLWDQGESPLGGMEDQYLRLQGECHPDFTTTPIGTPQGPKLCRRRRDRCGREVDRSLNEYAAYRIESAQGYHRGCLNMYDERQRFPEQRQNAAFYSDRRTPWDADLVRRDYLRRPVKFASTGIGTVRTPAELSDAGVPYWEYAYTFTPREDPKTGMRTATNWSQEVAPPKYDITRLHQPWNVWKREAEVVGHPQDYRDTTHFQRIV